MKREKILIISILKSLVNKRFDQYSKENKLNKIFSKDHNKIRKTSIILKIISYYVKKIK